MILACELTRNAIKTGPSSVQQVPYQLRSEYVPKGSCVVKGLTRVLLLESSLVRHLKRCLADIRGPLRQKSCIQCSDAKARCSLKRPQCYRCASKQLSCEYVQAQEEEETKEVPKGTFVRNDWTDNDGARSTTSTSTTYDTHFRDYSSNNSSRSSFGTIAPIPASPPSSTDEGPISRVPGLQRLAATTQQHGLNHTIRILRTYPLMIAHRTQLPPFIHHLQFSDTVSPTALANCYNTLDSWEGFSSPSPAVESRILAEVDTLVRSVSIFLPRALTPIPLIRVVVDF